MRILVTGGRGKVGRATVDALLAAGHDVTAADLGAPVFERPDPGEAAYVQADLTDAGAAFAVVRGHDAVIHAAAIPEPTRNPPHVVFHNNLMSTFNAVEAAVRWGVAALRQRLLRDGARLVLRRAARSCPTTCPSTRSTRCARRTRTRRRRSSASSSWTRPSAAPTSAASPCARRGCSGRATSSTTSGPIVSGGGDEPSAGFWSYVDVYDLAEMLRLAAESDLPGPRGLLRRAARQLGRPAAGRPRPPPPRRRDPAARRRPPRCGGHRHRQGPAAAGLEADALMARLPRRDGRYSVALNSQIAMPSMTRPRTSTTATSSSAGTCQPHHVTPGASAARAEALTSRWLKTSLRIGSTA